MTLLSIDTADKFRLLTILWGVVKSVWKEAQRTKKVNFSFSFVIMSYTPNNKCGYSCGRVWSSANSERGTWCRGEFSSPYLPKTLIDFGRTKSRPLERICRNWRFFFNLAGCWPDSCKNWKTRKLWETDLCEGMVFGGLAVSLPPKWLSLANFQSHAYDLPSTHS